MMDTRSRLILMCAIVFHELAEAYSKVDLGKPYLVRGPDGKVIETLGAHVDAVSRELRLRTQRPGVRRRYGVGINGLGTPGEVLIMDHPVLGTTPGTGEVIAFSRSGAEKYTVKVRADSEGAYEVFLEPGRYRIIVPCLNSEKTELLDSLTTGQARHLDVHEGRSVRFDVRIRTCDNQ